MPCIAWLRLYMTCPPMRAFIALAGAAYQPPPQRAVRDQGRRRYVAEGLADSRTCASVQAQTRATWSRSCARVSIRPSVLRRSRCQRARLSRVLFGGTPAAAPAAARAWPPASVTRLPQASAARVRRRSTAARSRRAQPKHAHTHTRMRVMHTCARAWSHDHTPTWAQGARRHTAEAHALTPPRCPTAFLRQHDALLSCLPLGSPQDPQGPDDEDNDDAACWLPRWLRCCCCWDCGDQRAEVVASPGFKDKRELVEELIKLAC